MRATIVPVGGEVPDAGGIATIPARREGILLTLEDGDAIVGVGEASPLPGYSRETLSEARLELVAWQPPALDAHASAPDLLARAADGLRAPSARFAVEAAVLDWLGRRRGLPAHRLLGAAAARPPLATAHLLGLRDGVERARVLRARGVRHMKLKVGAEPDAEMHALQAIRAAVPDAVLRVDANGRLAAGDVPRLCAAYGRVGVTLVEEPCAAEALLDLPPLAIPIALDESLQRDETAALLAPLARAQTLAAVVLKPTALGGLLRCLALARRGAEVGAEPIVTHTFDGPVAMAAAAEAALALQSARIAGLAPHACLGAFPSWRSAALGETALAPHGAAGLGLSGAP